MLLLLLPPNSFAQAHLWKFKSFRAFDTGHSGGDHICDLRRDSNGDGKPDRLGDYVMVSGPVIAGPSTYETGGWLFWLRAGGCGILVYGEPECLSLGDSVEVCGRLRRTNGNYFFPETGIATLRDVAIEKERAWARGTSRNHLPVSVSPSEFVSWPEKYGGNLICVAGVVAGEGRAEGDGDRFIWMTSSTCSLPVYLDADTGCVIDDGYQEHYSITGIVMRMKIPTDFALSPSWVLAPRCTDDIAPCGDGAGVIATQWGEVKAGFTYGNLALAIR